MMPTPNQILEAADELREKTLRQIDDVQTNPRLMEQAKADDIAAIRQTAIPELEKLRDQFWATVDTELSDLRRKVASPDRAANGAEQVAIDTSFRDALERARATDPLDPAALRAVHDSAALVSDALQARAAMVVGLERDDLDVVNAWLRDNPAAGPDVESMYQRQRELDDPQARMNLNMRLAWPI